MFMFSVLMFALVLDLVTGFLGKTKVYLFVLGGGRGVTVHHGIM